jgi:hypothetical protein
MGGRPFDFSDTVKWETMLRQEYRCGACKRDLRKIPDEAHHVVPNQSGNRSNPAHRWLKESINCIFLCYECHEEVHEDGNYQTGHVPLPSFYKFSHGGDIKAHRKWVVELNRLARTVWLDLDI